IICILQQYFKIYFLMLTFNTPKCNSKFSHLECEFIIMINFFKQFIRNIFRKLNLLPILFIAYFYLTKSGMKRKFFIKNVIKFCSLFSLFCQIYDLAIIKLQRG